MLPVTSSVSYNNIHDRFKREAEALQKLQKLERLVKRILKLLSLYCNVSSLREGLVEHLGEHYFS